LAGPPRPMASNNRSILQSSKLLDVARDLSDGRATSVALVKECLGRIDDTGHGSGSFVRTFVAAALAAAATSDDMRARGIVPSPLAGIPISIKDVLDVAGERTTAGSKALADTAVAEQDALVVRRLRAAGAIILGHTNMTELAYSGLGINPHYGTPPNPFDAERVPGGSSSGAAAATAFGFSTASIGSDTGGSVRIPAAFCGLVGFKPTQARIPRSGVTALSRSLDSVGPIGRSSSCCAILDRVMSNEETSAPRALAPEKLHFAVPRGWLTDGLDRTVARAFEQALTKLSRAGVRLTEQPFPESRLLAEMEGLGGILAPEALAEHGALIESAGQKIDPRVRMRLLDAGNIRADAYINALRIRSVSIAAFNAATAPFHALVAPTVPIVPPRFDELVGLDDYRRINKMVLRNTAVANLLDRCSVSLPCRANGALSVGLMLIGTRDQDVMLLSIGAAIESLIG
jgi:aspartyl-tRNA(Asn)/glutamyl-tRNA(Gln) amidotransferase subunit A